MARGVPYVYLPEEEMKCSNYVEQSVSGESVTAINTIEQSGQSIER